MTLEFDRWVLLGSVPRLFGTTLATIPFPAGFLQPDPARRGAWARRLARGHGAWAWSGPAIPTRRRMHAAPFRSRRCGRCSPCRDSASSACRWGRRRGDGAAEPAILDVAPALADFAETAAAVAELDLVVSVDTAVAHLAGALGRPCWLLCPDPAGLALADGPGGQPLVREPPPVPPAAAGGLGGAGGANGRAAGGAPIGFARWLHQPLAVHAGCACQEGA